MSDQAVIDRKSETSDLSVRLQERIRVFTAFYEQHAYLVYNLALRITCAPEVAARVVQRSFLSQLDVRSCGLVPATVKAALQEANVRPDPAGAGDAQAEAMLAAVSQLAPPERAAIALADVAGTGPDEIGDALGLPSDRTAQLLHRAREGLAARLELPRTQADEAARGWLWAAPPAAVWEELYPHFHQAVEAQLRRGAGETALVFTRERSAGRRRGPRRRPTRWRWSHRPRWAILVSAVALTAVAAVAGARVAGGVSGSTVDVPTAEVGAAGSGAGSRAEGSPGGGRETRRSLSPALLDRLRLRELDKLKTYMKRLGNERATSAERRAASKGIGALRRKAQRRLRARQRREALLRERRARARARAEAPSPPPPRPSARSRAPEPTGSQPKPEPQTTTPSAPPRNREEAEQRCLRDEESGQYICPE